MLAQCWLHIGTEKTGSTSIQTFFGQNRAALLARGWLYPVTTGVGVHHRLLAYGLADKQEDGTRRIAGVDASLDTFRTELIGSIESEIATSGASALVLSNERLATRLRRPAEIVRMKALCDRLAHDAKVVVYLRNQVDFLASRYTNVIWEGGTGEFDFQKRATIADYAALLDRWSDVFGKQNLVVRRFEPAEFPARDVIADFARAIGLDARGLEVPGRANPSLDTESLVFLRGMNRRLPLPLAKRVQPFRGHIVRVLQRRRGGTAFTIPRLLADRIEDVYRDSNERVSAEYFGSRHRPLFSPPFLVSDAPAPDSIGAVSAMRIGAFLAVGLLRDGAIWAGNRLFRRA